MTKGFPAGLFLAGMIRQNLVTALEGGIEAAVRLYYDDYSEATALDGALYQALRVVSGEYDNVSTIDGDLDELIEEIEQKIHEETGRKFDSLSRDRKPE